MQGPSSPRLSRARRSPAVFAGLVVWCLTPPADAEIIETEIRLTASSYADDPRGSLYGDTDSGSVTNPTAAFIHLHSFNQGSRLLRNDNPDSRYEFMSEGEVASLALVYNGGTSGFMQSHAFAKVDVSRFGKNLVFSNSVPAQGSATARVLLRTSHDRDVHIRGNIRRRDTAINGPVISLEQDVIAEVLRNRPSNQEFDQWAGVWTVETDAGGAPVFPGTSLSTGFPDLGPLSDQLEELENLFQSETDPVFPPSEVSGSFLTGVTAYAAPVQAEYGTTDRLFFDGAGVTAVVPAAANALIEAASAAASPLGYYVSTLGDSPLFASFGLADVDPDLSYEIFFDGITRTLLGSEVIDFTAFVPGGVSDFFLSGLAGHEGDGLPYAFSATFADEGTAQFAVGQVHAPAAVPEPSSLVLLGLVGLGGVGRGWMRRRRKVMKSV